MLQMSDPVTNAPLIGNAFKALFAKLDVYTIGDLLHHYPSRYIDYSNLAPIAELPYNEGITVQGRVENIFSRRTKKGLTLTRARIADETGTIEALWFNQPYIVQSVKEGDTINLSGKLTDSDAALIPTMKSPEYEVISPALSQQPPAESVLNNSDTPKNNQLEPQRKGGVHTGRITPIYPETKGISSKRIRAILHKLWKPALSVNISDPVPEETLNKYELIPLEEALLTIHFPESQKAIDEAQKRLGFDELLLMQLRALARKKEWQEKGIAEKIIKDQLSIHPFTENLPYTLTTAQQRCIDEIHADLAQETPMNRLLEGDVGAGKTAVAAAAMYSCKNTGLQSVFIAPTEVLAEQHYTSLRQLMEPFDITIDLHTGSTKTMQEQADIVIGTHALLYEGIQFRQVGLVIIDEQHRFGVNQRAKLIERATSDTVPHVLSMTATPIPRTMALTLYGDLDISILDELPPGRKEIKTHVVKPEKRAAGEAWIREQIAQENAQVFVICPLIEESETLQTKAAKTEYERLKKEVFPEFKVDLVHGGMKPEEKRGAIDRFTDGETHILVSTSVIEVGVDIPNATIMVIEGAERFGLASLHQLRGRVGRGERQSYCFLYSGSRSPSVFHRLRALEQSNNGFELAELDLKTRGPGEAYGLKQSGVPQLKIATLGDASLLEATRNAAQEIMKKGLSTYPGLSKILDNEQITPN